MRKFTKTAFLAMAALLVFLCGPGVLALGPAPYPTGKVEFEKYVFDEPVVKAGEKSVMRFNWNGVDAAVVDMRVFEDPKRPGWICAEAEGKIIGKPALLYRGHDTLSACMRQDAYKPDHYEIHIRESLDYYDMYVDFDHEKGKAYRKKHYRKRESEKDFTFTNAYCPVSASFLVRSLPWKAGDERSFEVINGNDRYKVVFAAVAEETITVPAGTFETVRIEPSVFEMPSQRDWETPRFWERQKKKDEERLSIIKSFTLWMATDGARPIVKARTDVFFGHVDMELAEFTPGE